MTPIREETVANLEFMESSHDLATDMKLILQEHSVSSTHHYMKIMRPMPVYFGLHGQ